MTINQGGPFAPALEELIASGADLPLAEIEDAIPLGHGVLRGAALAATRRLAASAERSPEQQARWANTLAIRLSEAGEAGRGAGGGPGGGAFAPGSGRGVPGGLHP